VGKFGNSVPDAFVNGTSHIATLNVGDGNLQVSGGHGGGQHFKPVAAQDHNVRLQVMEKSGKFYDAHAGSFGFGQMAVAFQIKIKFVKVIITLAFQNIFDISEF